MKGVNLSWRYFFSSTSLVFGLGRKGEIDDIPKTAARQNFDIPIEITTVGSLS